jgi:hypothetical protein
MYYFHNLTTVLLRNILTLCSSFEISGAPVTCYYRNIMYSAVILILNLWRAVCETPSRNSILFYFYFYIWWIWRAVLCWSLFLLIFRLYTYSFVLFLGLSMLFVLGNLFWWRFGRPPRHQLCVYTMSMRYELRSGLHFMIPIWRRSAWEPVRRFDRRAEWKWMYNSR